MQGKRAYSITPKSLMPKKTMKIMLDDPSFVEPTTTSSYMDKVGEEMENIIASTGQQYVSQNDIANSLTQLGNDLTDIKSTLQNKRPKISLANLDEKLNYIISMLQNGQQND